MSLEQEIKAVKILGEAIGYGHLMNLASALWRKDLSENGVPIIGAFVPTIFFDKEARESAQQNCKLYDELINKCDFSHETKTNKNTTNEFEIMNKPLLSLNEFKNEFYKKYSVLNKSLENDLIELAKQKLNLNA